jgi:hypothetical protein
VIRICNLLQENSYSITHPFCRVILYLLISSHIAWLHVCKAAAGEARLVACRLLLLLWCGLIGLGTYRTTRPPTQFGKGGGVGTAHQRPRGTWCAECQDPTFHHCTRERAILSFIVCMYVDVCSSSSSPPERSSIDIEYCSVDTRHCIEGYGFVHHLRSVSSATDLRWNIFAVIRICNLLQENSYSITHPFCRVILYLLISSHIAWLHVCKAAAGEARLVACRLLLLLWCGLIGLGTYRTSDFVIFQLT